MRLAARVDSNQAAIVAALRQVGCRVLSLASVGRGAPDLIACRAEKLYLLEIKDGAKSASRRQLTPAQKRFHQAWPVAIVKNEHEALAVVGLQDPGGAELKHPTNDNTLIRQ
jgi:Holliday junction resolvase